MKRVLAVWSLAFLAVSLVACSSRPSTVAATPSASPSPSGAPPSPSPTPTRPPKPKRPGETRLEGTYAVSYLLVHSTVTGSVRHEVRIWTIAPNCKKGPCTSLIKSSTPGKPANKNWTWQARATYVKGRYRWTRNSAGFYVCGATSLASRFEYSIQITKIKLVDGQWVGSRFTGVLETKALESGGCLGLADERQIIKGKLTV
jgi:hypothetical protein